VSVVVARPRRRCFSHGALSPSAARARIPRGYHTSAWKPSPQPSLHVSTSHSMPESSSRRGCFPPATVALGTPAGPHPLRQLLGGRSLCSVSSFPPPPPLHSCTHAPHVACSRGHPLASGALLVFMWAHRCGLSVGRQTSGIRSASGMLEALYSGTLEAWYWNAASPCVAVMLPPSCLVPALPCPLLLRKVLVHSHGERRTNTRRRCPSHWALPWQRCSAPQCSDTHGFSTLLLCRLLAALTVRQRPCPRGGPRGSRGFDAEIGEPRFISQSSTNFARVKIRGACTRHHHIGAQIHAAVARWWAPFHGAIAGAASVPALRILSCSTTHRLRCDISRACAQLCKASGTDNQLRGASWRTGVASCVGAVLQLCLGTPQDGVHSQAAVHIVTGFDNCTHFRSLRDEYRSTGMPHGPTAAASGLESVPAATILPAIWCRRRNSVPPWKRSTPSLRCRRGRTSSSHALTATSGGVLYPTAWLGMRGCRCACHSAHSPAVQCSPSRSWSFDSSAAVPWGS
jgi:hypothetical protein